MAVVSVSRELGIGGLRTRARWSARDPLTQGVRRFVGQPAGLIGLCLVGGVLLAAAAAPVLAPYSPLQQFPGNELAAPSWRFLLGTDSLGRDLLSRIIFGTRVSVFVGLVAVTLGAGAGGASGLLAGYHRGRLDSVIMRVWDAIFAVPPVLLGIAFAATFRPSVGVVALTLGISSMPIFARLIRAGVLSERNKEYVQAARAWASLASCSNTSCRTFLGLSLSSWR